MAGDKHSSKSKRSGDSEREHKSKKRHKRRDDEDRQERKRKRREGDGLRVVDDDPDDEDMWVENNIDMNGENSLVTNIPTADSLKLTSHAEAGPSDPPLPPTLCQETSLKRDEWMLLDPGVPTVPEAATRRHESPGFESFTEDYGEGPEGKRTLGGGVDFFSGLGTERKKKPRPEAPDPEKVKVSSRELNPEINPSSTFPGPASTPSTSDPKPITPGGPGSQWRMMRLRRVFETAEEEKRPVEEVAIERFGSLVAFEEAQAERRVLDERAGKKAERGRASERRPAGNSAPASAVRYLFNESGGSSRSSSFRRPGAADNSSAPGTPSPAGVPSGAPRTRPGGMRLPSQLGTPIPSVMTPPVPDKIVKSTGAARALSPSSLNKLQAKVLRAKLMDAPDAARLEQEYEEEVKRANGGDDEDGGGGRPGVRTKVEVLPSLDGQGRLYDVGQGRDDDGPVLPGNRKKKEKFETRDAKTGEVLRYNADDDSTSLGDMLRQEKFGGGSSDQKNLDAEFARQIMTDGGFKNDLDYMDDNAEKLGRKKMRSDAMKRQFAINDYKKTQRVMATCPFCFGEDDSPPKAPVVAMATRAYLARTINEELVDGHCLIVPIQHHLTMLEGDDDVWDEVRNFMKCLMRMFAEEDKGVLFYETVISLKHQNHTFIECVPVPWEQYDDLPGYFKESILASELEWSQHKKLIDFSARPGGFRRAMVPNLPYFAVQFDYKGERGYGHVIEGVGGADKEAEEDDIDEGEKGGGVFPRYFAGEIIGNVLDLEARRWLRPRKIDFRQNKERVAALRKKYEKFDWTGMLQRS